MIKTNIKMRVTPEQSKKVQEICFHKGIYWSIGKKVQYLFEPFLFIEEVLSFMYKEEEEDFLEEENEEVDADLFIKTNGTCIEEKQEFTYPMWFKSKASGNIIEFTGLKTGKVIYLNPLNIDQFSPTIGIVASNWTPHTDTNNWEQIENPNEHLDKLDDIVDEAIKEVSVDINEDIKEVVSDGSKNKFYEIPDWVKDLDDLSEYLNLDPYEFNILKTLWIHKGKRHNGTNELREINKRLHYSEKSKEKYLRSEKDKE